MNNLLTFDYEGRKVLLHYYPYEEQQRWIHETFGFNNIIKVALKIEYENEMVEITRDVWPDMMALGKKTVHVIVNNPQRANPAPATVAPIVPNRPRPNVALGPAPPIERERINRGRQPRDAATPFPTANRVDSRPEQRAGPSAGPATQNAVNRPGRSQSRGSGVSRPRSGSGRSKSQGGRSRSRRRQDMDIDYPPTPTSMNDHEPPLDPPAKRTRLNTGRMATPIAVSNTACWSCRRLKILCCRPVGGGSRSAAEMSAGVDFAPIPCVNCGEEGLSCALEKTFGTRIM